MTRGWYTTRWCAIVLALAVAAANSLWIVLDRASPSWDQASYLYLAVIYNNNVAANGLDALPAMMQLADPARGPLYIVLLMPVLAVLGTGPTSALVLNALIAPVAYFAAGEIAWDIFRSWLARLLAIVLMAGTPLLVGLQHDVLVDFLLMALTCLGVMFLLKSHVFLRPWMTVLMAISFALGTLTKVTFPAFVLGPVLVVTVQLLLVAVRRREGHQLVRRCGNVAIALVIYLGIIATWYLPNREATILYVQSTTGGALSVGAGPEDPLAWANVVAFAVGVVNEHLSWPLLLAGVFVLVWHLPMMTGWTGKSGRASERSSTIFGAATLGLWMAVPYLLLVTGTNQDVRLMAPAFAAFAIAVAGGLARLRPTVLQATVIVVTVATLAFQTANRVVPLAPGWVPKDLSMVVGNQVFRAPIGSSAGIGYERLPRRDRTSPIYAWIDEHAAQDSTGSSTGVVCFFVTYPVANTNTFRYLVAAHGDAFELRDLRLGEGGLPALRADMDACDFAVYDDLRKVRGTGEVRLEYVNSDYAGNHVTRRMLRVFNGPSRRFPVGDASRAVSDAWPLDTMAVTVLSRTD